jgi:hypothetical protein
MSLADGGNESDDMTSNDRFMHNPNLDAPCSAMAQKHGKKHDINSKSTGVLLKATLFLFSESSFIGQYS